MSVCLISATSAETGSNAEELGPARSSLSKDDNEMTEPRLEYSIKVSLSVAMTSLGIIGRLGYSSESVSSVRRDEMVG